MIILYKINCVEINEEKKNPHERQIKLISIPVQLYAVSWLLQMYVLMNTKCQGMCNALHKGDVIVYSTCTKKCRQVIHLDAERPPVLAASGTYKNQKLESSHLFLRPFVFLAKEKSCFDLMCNILRSHRRDAPSH